MRNAELPSQGSCRGERPMQAHGALREFNVLVSLSSHFYNFGQGALRFILHWSPQIMEAAHLPVNLYLQVVGLFHLTWLHSP